MKYQYQTNVVNQHKDKEYGALFLEMGLGKSKIMIDILQANPDTKAVLILAPNGLHANWCFQELPKHYTKDCAVFYWETRRANSLVFQENLQQFAKDPRTQILLMNIEALVSPKAYQVAMSFIKNNSSKDRWVIIDESTCIKNYRADRTKKVREIAKYSTRRFILSGTPLAQSPVDLFSQVTFLSRTAIPYSTLTVFKSVFTHQSVRVMGARSFTQITGFKNLDHLSEIVSNFATSMKKEDVLDLPEKIFESVAVAMTPEQEKAYLTMKEACLIELEDTQLTATTALSKILRLQQIASGFCVAECGAIVPYPTNKLSTLVEMAVASKPVVIFAVFKENIRQIKEALAEHGNVVCYTGDESLDEKTEAVTAFQNGTADFFVATSAGSKGITLTRANTVIFYNNSFSCETRLQSIDRIHRIGQKRTCTYIDLITHGTVEQKILDALEKKESISNFVLTRIKELVC
jgi:SNF2 family DNA or RNA helicase